MYKPLLSILTCFLFLVATPIFAQVQGVGYTLAPRAGYLFPDDKSGMDRSFMLGGDLGISFGQFFELRGTYLQTINAQTDFSNFGISNFEALDPGARDVELRRIGGDLKVNLSRGAFLPYITVGTGVQRLKLDGGGENENIYGNAGLGVVLSAADRFTFFVEGRYTTYNSNPASALLTAEDRRALQIRSIPGATNRIGNYSLEAGLAFYLGGRRPGEMSELDEAFANQFGNGFSGASVLFEPGVSRINFADQLPYRDTWLGGGALGINFNQMVGIRGYYYRGMEGGNVNLDFEDLAIYGGDVRFNLNSVSTGLAPFLTLGGGYLDASGNYVGEDGQTNLRSQGFATGGGGVVLGLTRNLRIRGSVKGLLMAASDVEDLVETDQITTSVQYTIGLDLAFGQKAQDGEMIVDRERQQALERQRKANEVQKQELIMNYEERLASLEGQLNQAYAAQDSMEIQRLRALQDDTEDIITDLEKPSRKKMRDQQREEVKFSSRDGSSREAYTTGRMDFDNRERYDERERSASSQGGMVRMSVAEFENLIEEIFESTMPPMPYYYGPAYGMEPMRPEGDPNAGDPRMYNNRGAGSYPMRSDSAFTQTRRENEQLRKEMEQLRKDVEQMRRNASVAPAPIVPPAPVTPPAPKVDPQSNQKSNMNSSEPNETVKERRMRKRAERRARKENKPE